MSGPHDPSVKSWLTIPQDSDFSIHNLPYGVIEREDGRVAVGVAIGDQVLDLAVLQRGGLLGSGALGRDALFQQTSLNPLMAQGRPLWTELRERLFGLLRSDNGELRDHADLRAEAVLPQSRVRLRLPVHIPNFVDFYASKYHASNVGSMFRDPENPLLPNWVHMPVAYNGRSSSVIVSGQDIHRPCGQTKADDQPLPSYGPSRLLDFELEVGFFVGPGNDLGTRIPIERAPEHIFGMVLVNDWSARDIQKWEYVPLGPFLGKSFATSISPWVVTLDALEPFRVTGPAQDPAVLSYLESPGPWGYDLDLEVWLQPEGGAAQRLTLSNFQHMYWNIAQQLAHVTVNGTNAQTGDLYASGTVSGPTPESRGCMLELTWKGSEPVTLKDGSTRKFLADGDTVIMRGGGRANGYRVGFGELRTRILPAVP